MVRNHRKIDRVFKKKKKNCIAHSLPLQYVEKMHTAKAGLFSARKNPWSPPQKYERSIDDCQTRSLFLIILKLQQGFLGELHSLRHFTESSC